MINKILVSTFLVLFLNVAVSAQISKKEQKIFNKSVKMYNKKKYKKANELIDKVIENHRDVPILWRNKVEYCYQDYLANGSINLFSNMSITYENEGEVEDSEETEKLKGFFQAFMSMSVQKRNLRFAIREATRYTNTLNFADIYLRILFIDTKYPVDQEISQKARDLFNDAEDYFVSSDYNKAAEYFEKALQIEPNYYKARLYKGDCYYMLKEYSRAAPIFSEAAERFPDLLEPQKYYGDALMGMNQYQKAQDAYIDGLLRFPDRSMWLKLSSAADALGKEVESGWVPRECEVSRAENNSVYYLGSTDSIYPSYWNYYLEALENVEEFVDENGILSKNSITDYKTLEAYSWDYMLENADEGIEELETARKMKEKGMLEPYVLISLFHYDLFDQYKKYVTDHRDEATRYLNSLIN